MPIEAEHIGMNTEPTVTIIGAGQAGLAMSHCLTAASVDHVLVEKGKVANSWRTERWDSLRLLTPNWMSRLPGWQYRGDDPDGYMTAAEVIDYLAAYRRSFDPPIVTETTVTGITEDDRGFVVSTDRGTWRSRAVVIASGACSTPKIPAIADQLPADIRQLAPIHYRNPSELDDGPVMVVGASASGAQLADEIARSGRDVTMCVGDHVRLPRTYRGMDIHWWMNTIGILDERHDEVEDIVRARRVPSLQLVGSPEKRDLDLNSLSANGVRLVGRLAGISGSNAQFSGSFANQCASADLKMGRLLERIDEYATENGLDSELGAPDRPSPTVVDKAVTTLDLSSIKTIVWATGFKPDYPWLEPHLLNHKGAIKHDGGVMERPGMYALGLPFTRRRKSSFLDGVGPDATELAAHLIGHLNDTAVSASTYP